MRLMHFSVQLVTLLGSACYAPVGANAAAPAPNVIYQFDGGSNGGGPNADLLLTATGNIYGVTAGGGAAYDGLAFMLSPPAAGSTGWTYTVLYSFKGGADGAQPYNSGLVADKLGSLYGSTYNGGSKNKSCGGNGCGTIFKLSKKNGVWTESVIYRFSGGADGSFPDGVMARGYGGKFFGTTELGGLYNSGSVFELTPPSKSQASWTKSTIYSFGANASDGLFPYGDRLLLSTGGAIFGVTSHGGGSANCRDGCGTVFSLRRPKLTGQAWRETILHSFSDGDGSDPHSSLIIDSNGNLFGGTTNGGDHGSGVVYQLTPPTKTNSPWAFTLVHSMPSGSVINGGVGGDLATDSSGNVYGTFELSPNGIIFKLSPPVSGGTAWTMSTIATLNAKQFISGTYPAGIIFGPQGQLFGTTYQGGVGATGGMVYEFQP